MRFDVLVRTDTLALNVNLRAALSLLGYRKGRTALSQVSQGLVEECLEEGFALAEPAGAYRLRRLERRGPREFEAVGSPVPLVGRSMERLLEGCFAVCFLAVTIGPRLEERVSRYAEAGQADRAVVLDAIGSELAEAAAVALNDRIRTEARQRGWSLTRRFSPGYGDLPLSVQPAFAQELDLESLGVAVTDSYLLVPQKSITALVGVR